MNIFEAERYKWLPTLIGIVFVFLFSLFLYFHTSSLGTVLNFIENAAYNIQLRSYYKPVSKELPLIIVDIDDTSLLKEGRWPWPRKKLAILVSKLFELRAKVIAFDITFPESEENIAIELSKDLSPSNPVLQELGKLQETYDYDAIFASALQKGNSVLGFVFKNQGDSTGKIPPPFLPLPKEELFIPDMPSYLGNLPILQEAAKYGAFINSTPDSDGIIRFSPLILRHGNGLYPSLALEAARIFLGSKEASLVFNEYGTTPVLEGIRLDKQSIPTDPYGKILIPFRGPPYSIPTISATDVLNERADPKTIADKLIFIGSSATALGDLIATAIAPVFAGVEVHADIASGILENYLPAKPEWAKGVSIFLVLVFGLIFAIALPLMEPIGATLLMIAVPALLFSINRWIWMQQGIVLSVTAPVLTLSMLYLMNLVWGFLFEKQRRKEAISIFGSYVPPDFIPLILKQKGILSLEGETRELTVLFADIRNFTSISETLSASELKKLLNEYLTPMTQIIFDHKGTIDKYVGDMIMAFWGAPLADQNHASDAVLAALDMQKGLASLNEKLKQEKQREIHIGIGINTGQMNVGDMGSKFRRAYTVLGDAVNLASRLEGICKYYGAEVIVGENTFLQTEKMFCYRKLDKVKVKGKDKAIEIYEPFCPANQCDAETLEILAMHSQALDAYFQRNWDLAEQRFKELLARNEKGNHYYKIFLDRIAHFRNEPPGPDWDGIFVFEEK